MPHFQLAVAPERAWRVGYDDAWSWTPWEYATNGRFAARWDDSEGVYRVLYAGSTLLACLVEVLAVFRPDPNLLQALSNIVADERDADYICLRPGQIPRSWLRERCIGSARLWGEYVDIEHSSSISTLRPTFVGEAIEHGAPDFDASSLRLSAPRHLTQRVSTYVYRAEPSSAGLRYWSRHGSEFELWAVFERPDDQPITPEATRLVLSEDLSDIATVLRLHHLEFVD